MSLLVFGRRRCSGTTTAALAARCRWWSTTWPRRRGSSRRRRPSSPLRRGFRRCPSNRAASGHTSKAFSRSSSKKRRPASSCSNTQSSGVPLSMGAACRSRQRACRSSGARPIEKHRDTADRGSRRGWTAEAGAIRLLAHTTGCLASLLLEWAGEGHVPPAVRDHSLWHTRP